MRMCGNVPSWWENPPVLMQLSIKNLTERCPGSKVDSDLGWWGGTVLKPARGGERRTPPTSHNRASLKFPKAHLEFIKGVGTEAEVTLQEACTRIPIPEDPFAVNTVHSDTCGLLQKVSFSSGTAFEISYREKGLAKDHSGRFFLNWF